MSVKANPVMAAAVRTKRVWGAEPRRAGGASVISAVSRCLPFFFFLFFPASANAGLGAAALSVASSARGSSAVAATVTSGLDQSTAASPTNALTMQPAQSVRRVPSASSR